MKVLLVCAALCTVALSALIPSQSNGICPPGVVLVNCFVDPCMFAKCPSNPSATCRSNYCGGCNADFYLEGKTVDCGSSS